MHIFDYYFFPDYLWSGQVGCACYRITVTVQPATVFYLPTVLCSDPYLSSLFHCPPPSFSIFNPTIIPVIALFVCAQYYHNNVSTQSKLSL